MQDIKIHSDVGVEKILIRIDGRVLAIAVIAGLVACQALLAVACDGTEWLHGRCEARPIPSPPRALLCAQLLWNAVQVAHMLLVLMLVLSAQSLRWFHQRIAAVGLLMLSALLLFVSHFVTSPGALGFGAVALVSAVASLWHVRGATLRLESWVPPPMPARLGWAAPEQPRQAPEVGIKHELLACLCFSCSMLYNMWGSRTIPPYIFTLTEGVSSCLPSLTADEFVRYMYWLGSDAPLPSHVPGTRPVWKSNIVGVGIFTGIWAFLPCLYIAYFLGLLLNSKKAPWVPLQQALCLYGILHFAVLTDGVDYDYGRGLKNTPHAACFHNSERFCWRLAVILGLYQKVYSGELLRIPCWGRHLHAFVVLFLPFFTVFQVVLTDGALAVSGFLPGASRVFDVSRWFQWYYRSLLVLSMFWGVVAALGSGKRLVLRSEEEEEERVPLCSTAA